LRCPWYTQNEISKLQEYCFTIQARVFTYSLLGLLFGIIGEAIFMAGIQQTLSLTIGVVILLIIFLPAAMKNSAVTLMTNTFSLLR
jgi:uncharacterized protein